MFRFCYVSNNFLILGLHGLQVRAGGGTFRMLMAGYLVQWFSTFVIPRPDKFFLLDKGPV
jgi:hypothetical protein